jgi:hypothetical protein
LAICLVLSLVGSAIAVRRLIWGPHRKRAAAWGLACVWPWAFWGYLSFYTLWTATTGRAFPRNLVADTAAIASATLLEGVVPWAYPHRLESERLVLFFDDRISNPQRDLEEMERHVAGLERQTGKALRAKIHWVRGEIFGRRNFSIRGLAFGSPQSPADWVTADHELGVSVDRHELAHAFMHQAQPIDADPPTLLAEGWAESQNGMSTEKRAGLALHSRALWRERTGLEGPATYVEELTDQAWYHRLDGPIYNVGGAFAEYLLRKHGTEKFMRLYFESRPGTFSQTCAKELGVKLVTLEAEFWAEAERLGEESTP